MQQENFVKKQNISDINIQEDDSKQIQAIQDVLLANITKSELPPFFYSHIAGMIQAEQPNYLVDLVELITPFIQNGNIVQRKEADQITETIFNQLNEIKAINNMKKQSIVTDKLEKPVILGGIQLITKKDEDLEDAFRSNVTANANDEIDEAQRDKKKQKKKDKEKNRAAELYDKFVKDQMQNKNQLPPMEVKRDRNIEGKNQDIILENISMIIGGRALLESTDVKIVQGRKYGLVGRNGIGKTCFMSALARRDYEKIPKHVQILLVEQEMTGSPLSPIQFIVEADTERTKLLVRLKEIEASDNDKLAAELPMIHERLEQIESHLAESKAAEILGGLGFTHQMMNAPTAQLSGGWRMRCSLARALFIKPDILLLDEPTNHLDLDAVMWLEDYIVECENTVVVVSHAREFLNIISQEIILFENQKLENYKGNYDTFETTKYNKRKLQAQQHENQQMKIAHMQKFIDKFRYNAKRASLVQSRIKSINRMDIIEDIIQDPSCVFIFPDPEKLKPPLLKIENGLFGYSKDSIILKNLQFAMDGESRVAIVGANGAGKSTFLKLLIGQLELLEGTQVRNPRVRCSMFTQHHIDLLNLKLSPLEQLMDDYPGSTQESYRSHLSKFGISGNMALRPNYLLSGGQKSRVAFALSVWNNPHLLVMDEPTNHLDLDAVNALIVALNNYQGGLLIVSHDQHLISTVCENIFYVKNQRLKQFNGNFQDYRKALQTKKLE